MTVDATRTARCPVIDYDFADPVVKPRLHETLAEIRQRCPIGWSEQYGGFWLLTTYEGVLAVAHDRKRYTTTEGIMIPPTGASMPVIPAELDPPEHTPYRKLIMPFFTKPAIASLEPQLRAIVRECIAAFSADGYTDLVRSVAEIVPPLAIGAALGLQPEECTGVRELTGNFLSSAKAGIEAKTAAAKELESWLERLIVDRRSHPRDDTLSKLVNARINGEEIPPEIALGMVQLVVVAGHETTVHGIGSMLFRLVTEPGLKDRLLADPTMMRATVHESLRIDPPIIHMARTAVDDHTRSGAQLRRGDKVMLNFGAANRDPAKFPEPFTFDIDRASNQHLTFGAGYHRCLGEYLAVTEMLIVLEEILSVIPDYALSGEGGAAAIEWGGGGNTRGPAKLEVVFTPVSR